MDALDELLAGWQESLLPSAETFWRDNPPLQYRRNSDNKVFELRNPDDDGHIVLNHRSDRQTISQRLTPAEVERKFTPEQTKSTRRHRSKGKASGWIETREGNTKREYSTTSYYYCYYQWEGDERRKRKIYIPNRWISHLRSLIEAGTTVDSIIQFLNGSKL